MLVLIILIMASLAAFHAPANAESLQEQWFLTLLDGQQIGYARHTRQVLPDRIVTSEYLHLQLMRGGTPLELSVNETCIESTTGKPIGFTAKQNLSLMTLSARGTLTEQGDMAIAMETAGMAQQRVIELPDDALMTEGLRRLQYRRGLEPGTTTRARLFSPSLMAVVEVESTVIGPEVIHLKGQTARLMRVETVLNPDDPNPVRTISWIDDDMVEHKMTLQQAGLTFDMIQCRKQEALRRFKLVEIFNPLLIPAPEPMAELLTAETACYELRPKPGLELDLPTSATQTVQTLPDGSVYVTVTKPCQLPKAVRPYQGRDPDALAALHANSILQSNDPNIVALAERAIKGSTDASQAARRIEQFVHDYVDEKGLSIAYASAAEVAQTRQGDCSEHAVLAAALCRAMGIPARIASGSVYVPVWNDKQEVFGGHMWFEVFLDGQWYPLDATRAPNGFSAGHIAVTHGSGQPEDFLATAGMTTFTITAIRLDGCP